MELWWLDHYRELHEHLRTHHREIVKTTAGVAYELLDRKGAPPSVLRDETRVAGP